LDLHRHSDGAMPRVPDWLENMPRIPVFVTKLVVERTHLSAVQTSEWKTTPSSRKLKVDNLKTSWDYARQIEARAERLGGLSGTKVWSVHPHAQRRHSGWIE